MLKNYGIPTEIKKTEKKLDLSPEYKDQQYYKTGNDETCYNREW